MKAIAEHIYQRGKRGNLYVRRRIPDALRSAYPVKQTHITLSLGTSDLREGKTRARAALQRIDVEFESKRHQRDLSRASITPITIRSLTDVELETAGKFWGRQVLLADDRLRQEGMDDEEFEGLDAKLKEQRARLGRMLAQGQTASMFPALHGYLSLCGMDYVPSSEEEKRASHIFTRTVVETLDYRLRRQSGDVCLTDSVAPDTAHPLEAVQGHGSTISAIDEHEGPTWGEIFELWRTYVPDRPKSTAIAAQTPWRDLERFVSTRSVLRPGDVTAFQMSDFAQAMSDRGLAVDTINERLSKIKGIYKIAVGKHKLSVNPASATLGFKESSAQKRVKRRLPFSAADLDVIFSSPIFTEHKRSSGQSGEASYWIPIMMYYTGARPEELAGLAISDIREEQGIGWYISIEDSNAGGDVDLFPESPVPATHQRTVKNAPSVRCIPVAQELLDLGLMRYVDWLRKQGAVMLFPDLRKDSHDKLSGSFSKFFGRYKVRIGIKDPRKVLYSFRHTMKDLLEQAEFPTKYLQRFLGHTSGDGAVTDGYGSGLPMNVMASHFSRVIFHPLLAKPWRPGTGSMRF